MLVSRLLSESPSPSDSGDFYRGPDDDTPLGEGDFSRTGEEIGDETLNELLAELEENPPQAGSSSSAGGSGNEGHGFVRLLRIVENVDPLAFNFPLADEVGIEVRDGDPIDDDDGALLDDALSVSVELLGAGADGIFSLAEIGDDGSVTARVILGDDTEVGDRLVVVAADGSVLLDRPVTVTDLTEGVDLEVPVAPGDDSVSVQATVTDADGNSDSDDDTKPIDDQPPTVEVNLAGAGDDGVYNLAEIGDDGSVTARVTLGTGTEVGDTLRVTDSQGNVLLERSVTGQDLSDGLDVEVPVTKGDESVSVTATVTDPAGNSDSDDDTKPIDDQPPTVEVNLSGAGDDGVYNLAEIGDDDSVTARVTLGAGTEVGDTLRVTDSQGNVLLERSVTAQDLSDGLDVEVPVATGDESVGVTATVTDPAGNSDSDDDTKPIDEQPPTVEVNLSGAGSDGVYNLAEIGDDGSVTARVTLGAGTEVGDTLRVTDSQGNVLLERSVTAQDLSDGLDVEVPVATGDESVSVTATVTDPAGNSDSDDDTKPIDDQPPSVTISLIGAGDDGAYQQSEIGNDDSVTARVNLGAGTEVGDTLRVTDGQGNVLLERSVTAQDLSDGLDVEVPVVAGQTHVQANARVTDPAGNSDDALDRKPVALSIELSASSTVVEGEFITVTATMDNVADRDVVVTLEDGNTITIVEGERSASIQVASRPDEHVNQGETSRGFSIESATPTGYDQVDLGDGVTTLMVDDNDITRLVLKATPEVKEGGAITYTVELQDPQGQPRSADKAIAVTLANGESLTVPAGQTSASVTVAAPSDDVYVDPGQVVNSIREAKEVEPDGQPASGIGTLEKLEVDSATVSTQVNDTIDEVVVSLSAPDDADEGQAVSVTLTVEEPPQGGPLTITLDDGTKVVIAEGATSAQVTLRAPDQDQNLGPGESADDTASWTIGIDTLTGGNYEKLVAGGDKTVIVHSDVPELTIPDDNGPTVAGDASVSEAGLESGSLADDSDVVSGVIAVGSGGVDEVASVAFGSISKSLAELQAASASQPISIDMAYGTLSITGYDAVADELSYTYTLTKPANHASGSVVDSLAVKVTDDSGDSRQDNLDILIRDDGPSATSDSLQTTTEGDARTSGTNLLVNDTLGADGARVESITFIDRSGATTARSISDGGSVTVETRYGSLTVASDGNWSYTPVASAAHPRPQGNDSGDTLRDDFSYVLIDADGSRSNTAQQPVLVKDTEPSIGDPTDGRLDEQYLASGSEPNTSKRSVSGDLDVNKGQDTIDTRFTADTVATLNQLGLTSENQAIGYSLSSDGHTLTARADGETVFTISVLDAGSNDASYRFTLEGPLDHVTSVVDSNGNIVLTLPFEVIDSDGDIDEDDFQVTVVDDPAQESQSITLKEDGKKTFSTPANATEDTLAISDAPEYGSVTIGADGRLTYKPDGNYSGADAFTYTYTEGGTTYSVDVDVTVTPVADKPDLPSSSAATDEDVSVALGLAAPSPTDTTDQNMGAAGDNPELLGAITVSGLPSGAKLLKADGSVIDTKGKSTLTIKLSDGSHLSTLDDGDVDLVMTRAEFEGLKVAPKAQDGSNFSLSIQVSSYEVDADGERLSGIPGATSAIRVPVTVQAVTDDVTLTFADDTDHKVFKTAEDVAFNLSETLKASFEDLDGSEYRELLLEGLPEGTVVTINDNLTRVVGASGQVRVPAGGLSASTTDFPKITITPPDDFSGEIKGVSVTLRARDGDADGPSPNGVWKEDKVTLDIDVTPVVDDPSVSARGTEDEAFKFLASLKVGDDDGGGATSETITSIEIAVVPDGWEIRNADGNLVHTGNGSDGFSVPKSDVDSGAFKNYSLTGPAHESDDPSLTLKVGVTDTATIDGATVSDEEVKEETYSPKVAPKAEVIAASGVSDSDGDGKADLTMTGGHTYGASDGVAEDEWFKLTNDDFDLKDDWSNQDSDGSEKTFARLTPEQLDGQAGDMIGASFRYLDEAGQWVEKSYDGTPVEIPVQHLSSVEFRPPTNRKGTFQIRVQAKTVDTDGEGNVDTSVSGEALLTGIRVQEPVADRVSLGYEPVAQTDEDTAVALELRPQSDDPNEVYRMTLSDLPDGAVLHYNGQQVADDGNGNYIIDNFDASVPLTITPPPDSNEDFSIKATPVSVDTFGGVTSEFTGEARDILVKVKGVADAPEVTTSVESYVEQALDDGVTEVRLSDLVTVQSGDRDDSESLAYRISGLDEGFAVAGAVLISPEDAEGDERVWVTRELADVRITTPDNFSGRVDFSVTPVVTEDDGDSRDGDQHQVSFEVTPSPEGVIETDSRLVEDTLGKLDFSLVTQNGDTNEMLETVWIDAADVLQAPFTIYVGNSTSTTLVQAAATDPDVTLEGGEYKLTNGAWERLYAKGDANFGAGSAELALRYQVTDTPNAGYEGQLDDVTSAPRDAIHQVVIDAVTDTPTIDITSIVNLSGGGVSITGNDVNAGTGDRVQVNVAVDQSADADAGNQPDEDGSESLRYFLIDGVPEGVSVEGAEYIGVVAGDSGGRQWRIELDPPQSFDGPIPQQHSFVFVLGEGGQLNDINNHSITITAVTQDAGGNTLEQSASASWTLSGSGDDNDGEDASDIERWDNDSSAAMTEDSASPLSQLIDAQIAGNDGASSITLSNLPPGTVVTGMEETTVNGQSVWYASTDGGGQAALDDLMASISVTPPANWNDNGEDFTFDATLTTRSSSGKENSHSVTVDPPVTPVTDTPEVSVSGELADNGRDVDFEVGVTSPADSPDVTLVDGQLVLTLDESGATDADGGAVPGGTLFYNGQALAPGSDGRYVIDGVAVGDTVNLTYRPAVGVWGDVSLVAEGSTQETDATNREADQDQASVEVPPPPPEVSVNDIRGEEDSLIDVSGLEVDLLDPSQTLEAVLIDGLPNGWLVMTGADAASATLAENVGKGSWSILKPDGSLPAYVGLIPPRDWSGDLSGADSLSVTAIAGRDGERYIGDEAFSVLVDAVADPIEADPLLSFGDEGDRIPLNLNASVLDRDGSEQVTLTLKGLGEHASFFSGDNLLDWTYDAGTDTYVIDDISIDQLNALTLVQKATDGNVTLDFSLATVDGQDTLDPPYEGQVDLDIRAVEPTTGDDTLLYSGKAINGLGGDDVVELRFGEDIDPGKVRNIETLDLMGEGQDHDVTLSAQDVLDMTSGDELFVRGDAGDRVSLRADEWSATGNQVQEDGITYNVYDGNGNAVLKIQDGIDVDI
ncbi:immunoglobulin-like domain-containing protein [Halomonas sp. MMSF_3323]|uniref:immunoglobulin-like domain-containing protein n=1 Tax=Halomonas sp. MMSF_3323 TaxID=3046701 RepID=UPI00273E07DC|nr:immunoglobulin-like domain-containing protein [Halomonas sp. MMSF_3323]